MKKLIEGIIDFRKKSLDQYRAKFANLALRQSPDVLFVACCDSRVVPNVFASSDPGDLFVLRNIGNLIPPYHLHGDSKIDASVAAAIEFSLISLEVRHIVICGHSECGAMQTLLDDCVKTSCLNTWLEYAAPSYKRFQSCASENSSLTPCNFLSRINVRQQMDNLKTYPLIMERLQNNKLKIHGWWFDLATADVYHCEPKSEEFVLVDEEEARDMLKTYENVIVDGQN